MSSLLASLKTKCLTCDEKLHVERNIDSTLYVDVGISKYCSNCRHMYYPGYFESFLEKIRQYYEGWESYRIFLSTIYSSGCVIYFAAYVLSHKRYPRKTSIVITYRIFKLSMVRRYTSESIFDIIQENSRIIRTSCIRSTWLCRLSCY